MVPSSAVTIVVMVLSPTFRLISVEGVPLDTGLPLTMIVAFASLAVGVTDIVVTSFVTDAV